MRRQDLVMVQNFTKTVGSIGQAKYDTPEGIPVPVDCNVYPLTAEEVTTFGLQLVETRKLICDTWPGNVHSVIAFEGDEWNQIGPTKNFNKSWAARSVQLIIQKRG